MTPIAAQLHLDFDRRRDAYGFTVRPQHIQTYRQYSNIYKEEEEERLSKWKSFLDQQPVSAGSSGCSSDDNKPAGSEDIKRPSDNALIDSEEGDGSTKQRPQDSEGLEKETEPVQNVTAEVNDTQQEESVPSGERDDSAGKEPGDSEGLEKETEPVQNVTAEVNDTPQQESVPSGERDDSAEKESGDSEIVEKEANHGQNGSAEVTGILEERAPSEERDDSIEQKPGDSEAAEKEPEPMQSVRTEVNDTHKGSLPPKATPTNQQAKSRQVKTWVKISPSLHYIEQTMGKRVKNKKNKRDGKKRRLHSSLRPTDGERFSGQTKLSSELSFPLKELECLVQGGVPKDLRGEVWQALVGVRTRRVKRYYQDLLAIGSDEIHDANEHDKVLSADNTLQNEEKKRDLPEKLKKQIEKDLPRTFPGHPALNDTGRNSLRRVLWAYARHNPSVGYCQAMNFFAGLLLLMMPEENAFWTLVGIIDDYFEGYFTQDMIESQVDQLVFEDLMREKFPKLVNHLEYLGVEVAWVSGPWFLSIFVNILPWESVLRVWDVLLFEGNRVMLFRTALALMDLYGPALGTTRDAGDAITLLQTLTGSTFDSSHLVMTACMGFLTVTEDKLNALRDKHRPAVLGSLEERTKGPQFKDAKGLATKLYSFKQDPRSIVKENRTDAGSSDSKDMDGISDLDSHSANLDELLQALTIDSEVDSLPDLQEQVVWLKVELCRLLEEKRSYVLRADELESAFMEMVQEDNRRELSARVEQLEQEILDLQQALADKKAAEQAMLQVLMKVEQEQKETEDARRFAEQEVAAQKHAMQVLEEKYHKAMAAFADMEKRAVMAESMLEATIHYESGHGKVSTSSPKHACPDSPRDASKKTGILSFSLGWGDRNKGKSSNDMPPGESKPQNDGSDKTHTDSDSSDHPN